MNSDIPAPGVLLLDDDAGVAGALRRLLRRTCPKLLVGEPGDVPALLADHEIAVVIAEPHLPGVASCLSGVCAAHPLLQRIILTGYPHLGRVIDAVNALQPIRVLTKPWVDDEVVAAVEAARQTYLEKKQLAKERDEMNEVRAITEQRVARRVLESFLASLPENGSYSDEQLAGWAAGALRVEAGLLAFANPEAFRLCAELGLPPPCPGEPLEAQPLALCALLAVALRAERKTRHVFPMRADCSTIYQVYDVFAGDVSRPRSQLVLFALGEMPRKNWLP